MPSNYGAVGEAEERGPRYYGGIVAAALFGVAVLAVLAVVSVSTSSPVILFMVHILFMKVLRANPICRLRWFGFLRLISI